MRAVAVPRIVVATPDQPWISIDDAVWLSGNVLTDGEPSAVLAVHVNPATGEQCRRSPRTIGAHTIVSRDPLTIRASLVCDEPGCTWHGWVTDGRWVPA